MLQVIGGTFKNKRIGWNSLILNTFRFIKFSFDLLIHVILHISDKTSIILLIILEILSIEALHQIL